jgi:hypothetical protein
MAIQVPRHMDCSGQGWHVFNLHVSTLSLGRQELDEDAARSSETMRACYGFHCAGENVGDRPKRSGRGEGCLAWELTSRYHTVASGVQMQDGSRGDDKERKGDVKKAPRGI